MVKTSRCYSAWSDWPQIERHISRKSLPGLWLHVCITESLVYTGLVWRRTVDNNCLVAASNSSYSCCSRLNCLTQLQPLWTAERTQVINTLKGPLPSDAEYRHRELWHQWRWEACGHLTRSNRVQKKITKAVAFPLRFRVGEIAKMSEKGLKPISPHRLPSPVLMILQP